MSEADTVTIDSRSTHTTTLAQLSKEYTAAYDRWTTLAKQAEDALTRAAGLQDEADKLKPEIDALRDKLRKALDA